MIDRTVGIGSSHTRRGYVWHMAIVIQGLTAQSPLEKEMCMMELVGTDAGRNLLHESFQPSNPALFSRELFAWVNALFVEFAEDYMGGLPSFFISDIIESNKKNILVVDQSKPRSEKHVVRPSTSMFQRPLKNNLKKRFDEKFDE